MQPAATPDKLYFHADSAAVPPGKGVHEQVADPARYASLWRGAARWREALSDSWEQAIQIPGTDRSYESVEHAVKLSWQLLAYEAAEMRGPIPPVHQIGFKLFCLDHNRSHLTTFPWLRLDAAEQAMWEGDVWKVRIMAQFAKFSESAELRKVLLDTGDAQLWEIIARGKKPAERAWTLETVRKALREGRTELSAEDCGEGVDSDADD